MIRILKQILLTNKAFGGNIMEDHPGSWRDGGEPMTHWLHSAWQMALHAHSSDVGGDGLFSY